MSKTLLTLLAAALLLAVAAATEGETGGQGDNHKPDDPPEDPAENVRYEKHDRKVNFLGKSPNFRIYPNASQPSYLQLKFGKIQELDANNKTVQGHVVNSLAAAAPLWESGNYTLLGTNMTYVSMTLDPTTLNNFNVACNATGNGNGNDGHGNSGPDNAGKPDSQDGGMHSGSGDGNSTSGDMRNNTGEMHGNQNNNGGPRRMLLASAAIPGAAVVPHARRWLLAASPKVKIILFFGLDGDADFPYGYNQTVHIAQGGLKFSVEVSDWPFCATANKLAVNIELALRNNGTASPRVVTDGVGTRHLSLPLGDGQNATMSFADYAFDSVNGTTQYAVSVSLDTPDEGDAASIRLRLPNPAPGTSIYYDPTVTTTTAGSTTTSSAGSDGTSYAGGTVSGSPNPAGSTGGKGDNGGGAAGTVRTSAMAVVGALLLSAFMSGGQGAVL